MRLEKYVFSVHCAIERPDVVLVVLDGAEGIVEQTKIAGYAHEAGRALSSSNNGCGGKDENTMREFEELIRRNFFLITRRLCFYQPKQRGGFTR